MKNIGYAIIGTEWEGNEIVLQVFIDKKKAENSLNEWIEHYKLQDPFGFTPYIVEYDLDEGLCEIDG